MASLKNRIIAFLCGTAMTAAALPALSFAADSVQVTLADGWFETAYAEWTPVSGASGYNVYADGIQLDNMLIRQYAGYYRADAPGLKAGSHTIKIVPVISGKEDSSKAAEKTVNVTANDRSGFAFVNGSASGAYNNDGTLKSNAVVLYVTNDTKDRVSMQVTTDSKGGTTAATGIQSILSAYQKGYETRPLDIRCIGNITDPSTLEGGDLLIKGNGASKRLSCGVTVEGIGTDTVFNGFGLRIANASNIEVRNIGFMNCNSTEGDDVGLQQNNDHIWVHNCDMFYGDAGSDADQAKGDGALDTKTSSYVTHSYNHFWDNGKCNLQGMKSESTENYITYHHNWFDHSDSRHPRIRTCSVHIYNNYYDGNAKYGVGVTMGASAFVENNYFRNCPRPMMSSMQGTDAKGDGTFSGEAGGIIKACNNTMTGTVSYITYQQNNSSFDAYEVSNPKDTVPASVKTLSGGTGYNNFDTSSVMYSYRADDAKNVPAVVTANAGRVQGGDFQWKFDNSADDASYAVNTALKSALVSYKGKIVAIGGGGYVEGGEPQQSSARTTATGGEGSSQTVPTTPEGGQDETQPQQSEISTPASQYIHNFTENGLSSSFYSITGNLSTGKGSMTYQGLTLTQCLKMETATSISFTTQSAATLTVVIKDGTTFKIDGNAVNIPADGVYTAQIAAGSHTVTKGSGSSNLFYLAVAAEGAEQPPATTEAPVQTTAAPVSEETTTAQPEETTAAVLIPKTDAGDVDCSGDVNIADAVLLARFCAEDKEISVSAQGKENANVNGDTAVNNDDLTVLLEYLAGLRQSF